jgi:hypothetical protein
LLPGNAYAEHNNRFMGDMADKNRDRIHQNDSDRPKTTGEWNREARETEGEPGERAKRIGKESAEAVKDFGSMYTDTAKRSANELRNNTTLGK